MPEQVVPQTVVKYAELLSQSKDQKDAVQREFAVEEAKQELDSALLNTKKSIAKASRELSEAKGKFPFNAQFILDKLTALKDYQAGLEALEALKAELF